MQNLNGSLMLEAVSLFLVDGFIGICYYISPSQFSFADGGSVSQPAHVAQYSSHKAHGMTLLLSMPNQCVGKARLPHVVQGSGGMQYSHEKPPGSAVRPVQIFALQAAHSSGNPASKSGG